LTARRPAHRRSGQIPPAMIEKNLAKRSGKPSRASRRRGMSAATVKAERCAAGARGVKAFRFYRRRPKKPIGDESRARHCDRVRRWTAAAGGMRAGSRSDRALQRTAIIGKAEARGEPRTADRGEKGRMKDVAAGSKPKTARGRGLRNLAADDARLEKPGALCARRFDHQIGKRSRDDRFPGGPSGADPAATLAGPETGARRTWAAGRAPAWSSQGRRDEQTRGFGLPAPSRGSRAHNRRDPCRPRARRKG